MNIIFKEIDRTNYYECAFLKIKSTQEGFVENNVISLLQSVYEKEWMSRAIYDNDIMIGYVMYGIEIEKNRVWLDRFMIDEKFQGMGYSKIVLDKIITIIKDKYMCDKIYLSINNKNYLAEKIYKDIGFDFNGEKDCGEDVMVLEA